MGTSAWREEIKAETIPVLRGEEGFSQIFDFFRYPRGLHGYDATPLACSMDVVIGVFATGT